MRDKLWHEIQGKWKRDQMHAPNTHHPRQEQAEPPAMRTRPRGDGVLPLQASNSQTTQTTGSSVPPRAAPLKK